MRGRHNTAYVSYDEGGAIFDVKEYVDALNTIASDVTQDLFQHVGPESLQRRRELWLKYQNDSQNIRAQTLKLALKGQFNLVVDTTSSSIGTKFLIAALRQLPFKEITMEGMFAPFEISRARIEARPRPTSGIGDLVGKRIGALEWIPQYAKMVDRFDFSYNPKNGYTPVSAFTYKKGEITHFDVSAIISITQDIFADTKRIGAYLQAVKENPALVAPEPVTDLDIDATLHGYTAAVGKMQKLFMEIIESRQSLYRAPTHMP